MKKLLLIFLLILPFLAHSQIFIKGRNLNQEKIKYIGVFKDLGMWKIDTGETNNLITKCRILNEKGLKMKFSSPVSLINYFYENGWEYVSDSDLKGFSNIHYYIFRKILIN